MKNILNILEKILKITGSKPARNIANIFCLNKARIRKEDAIKYIVENVNRNILESTIKKVFIAEECKLMQKYYIKNQLKRLSSPKYKKVVKEYSQQLEYLNNLSSSEEIIRYLAQYYAQDMAADFDPAFLIVFKELAKYLFPKMYNSIKVTSKSRKAIEKIKIIQGKYPVFFIPNHISNSDHLPFCVALNKSGLFHPVIVAGANLYRGASKNMLPKLNCYKLQRDYIHGDVKWLSNPIYNLVFKYYNKFLWSKNEPFLFYIEGTRTRTGKILPPKLGFLKEVLNFIKEEGKAVYFVPISISYTAVPEDEELVDSLKGKKISERDLISQHLQLEKIYSRVKDSSIYLNIAKPIMVIPEDIPKPTDFAQKIIDIISKNIVITPTYHVANAIIEVKNSDNTFDLNLVRNYLGGIFFKNLKLNYNFLILLEKEVSVGMDVFLKKEAIKKIGKEKYEILKLDLIEQYFNRIAHFKVKT
jgi:hypothetical protein